MYHPYFFINYCMNFDLILSNISKHVHLDQEQAEYFTSLLEPRTIAKKEFVTAIGEVCRYDTFVTSGCLKVCYIDQHGSEFIIKFALENWWVVDLDSFLNRTPAFYYIQAVEDSEVLQISRENYDALHERIPALQKFSHERWRTGFIALQHRIMQNLSLSAEERYERFKEKYPTLEQRIPQKLIAAYVGITPEFLSMLRKRQFAPIS